MNRRALCQGDFNGKRKLQKKPTVPSVLCSNHARPVVCLYLSIHVQQIHFQRRSGRGSVGEYHQEGVFDYHYLMRGIFTFIYHPRWDPWDSPIRVDFTNKVVSMKGFCPAILEYFGYTFTRPFSNGPEKVVPVSLNSASDGVEKNSH